MRSSEIRPVKVLLLGSGGREVAIAKALQRSAISHELYCFNAGGMNPQLLSLGKHCKYYEQGQNCGWKSQEVTFELQEKMLRWGPDLCIVGPEAALEADVVTCISQVCPETRFIGPPARIARLETDKAYARQFLRKYGLGPYCPTVAEDPKNIVQCREIIHQLSEKYVIKPTGLCSGKGVCVSGDHLATVEDGIKYCQKLLESNTRFLIEEKLEGREFSCMTITNGRGSCAHFPLTVDFKRAYDGDKGPNTGGMGSVSYPFDSDACKDYRYGEACRINETIIESIALEHPGVGWCGILFTGFMQLDDPYGSLKILECNMRFGDPEIISALATLDDGVDVLRLFLGMATNGTLATGVPITGELPTKDVSCALYFVPKGYPDKDLSPSEQPQIPKLMYAPTEHLDVIHGSLRSDYTMTRSRTLAILARGRQGMFDLRDFVARLDRDHPKLSAYVRYREDVIRTLNQAIPGTTTVVEYLSAIPITQSVVLASASPQTYSKDAYADAGVNIATANRAVSSIRKDVESTHTPNVLNVPGGFGGLFRVPKNMSSPAYLVSSTDSVGSKSELVRRLFPMEQAMEMLGQDLVNHCVNDILAMGCTQPLYFLDYYAAHTLQEAELQGFIRGVAKSCRATGCALIGGETAEIPAIYRQQTRDLAGFITGIVTQEELLTPRTTIRAGDVCIALPSVSAHTNGFTMLNKIFDANDELGLESSGLSHLMNLSQPHKCYLDEIRMLRTKDIPFKGLIHVTGGGLIDNPPRILPTQTNVAFQFDGHIIADRMPEMFEWAWDESSIAPNDYMQFYRVFNCGIGMIIVADPKYARDICLALPESFQFGQVIEKKMPYDDDVQFD